MPDTTVTATAAHHFTFSPRFDPDTLTRICGTCDHTWNNGDHIEIDILKPYTTYICSADDGRLGHQTRYTGAWHHENRTLRDGTCICGAPMVERDNEKWLLTFEHSNPAGHWSSVEKIASRHETHHQRTGLEQLAANGEAIRNITLTQLVPETTHA